MFAYNLWLRLTTRSRNVNQRLLIWRSSSFAFNMLTLRKRSQRALHTLQASSDASEKSKSFSCTSFTILQRCYHVIKANYARGYQHKELT